VLVVLADAYARLQSANPAAATPSTSAASVPISVMRTDSKTY